MQTDLQNENTCMTIYNDAVQVSKPTYKPCFFIRYEFCLIDYIRVVWTWND